MKRIVKAVTIIAILLLLPLFSPTSVAQVDIKYSDYEVYNMEDALREPSKVRSVMIFGDDKSLKLFAKKYKKLQNLVVLQIIGNDCSSLSDIIPSIKTIQSLKLNRCDLSEVPSFVLSMHNLVEIDVGGNNLTQFPYELGALPNLTMLTVGSGLFGGNQITEIDQKISSFENLKLLYMFQCPITEVSSEIGTLKNLEVLNLSQCRLTEIPKEIGSLTKLKDLDIGFNQLQTLPKEFGLLTNLEEFHCSNETLAMDFSVLKNLRKLRVLSVSVHEVPLVPKEILAMNELKTLYLYNQNSLKVEEVADSIIGMSKIETVKFYSCDFTASEKEYLKEELSDLEIYF